MLAGNFPQGGSLKMVSMKMGSMPGPLLVGCGTQGTLLPALPLTFRREVLMLGRCEVCAWHVGSSR